MNDQSPIGLNREVLLCPGPVMLSPGVKAAFTRLNIGHRDTRFSDLLLRLRNNCREVFRSGDQHSILFLGGSATSAIEAVFELLSPANAKVLVPVNGFFGRRLVEILEIHRIPHLALDFGFGKAIDLAQIEAVLAAERKQPFSAIAMTHHETSAGLLNPVAALHNLVRQYDLKLIVDATSSAGVEDLDVTRDGIDACITTSGKCLHGPPGIGLVCVRRDFLEEFRGIPARSYSRNLHRHHDQLEQNGQTPFTPSVPLFLALDCAIEELLHCGIEERRCNYWKRRDILTAGLTSLDLELFPLPSGCEAASILTVAVPATFSFDTLYAALKKRGYLIYGCKQPLAPRFFQVAVMGDLEEEDFHQFLKALQSLISGSPGRIQVMQG